MALWPEEFEALRQEARDAAKTLRGLMAVGQPAEAPVDLAARVRMGRELIKAREQTSPAGTDEVLAGIACRVFRPARPSRGTYLHIHGGALFVGSPKMNDLRNAELCDRLGVNVVSVDYRLAPEHPFPAGPVDCVAVARWLLDHEPGPIVIGGESAGAYLAALTLLAVRDELSAIDRVTGANLVYGVYDLSGTPSHRGIRPSDLPDLIGPQTVSMVMATYLPGRTLEQARDPAISPLYAALHDLPTALFTVGMADHLLDDSLFMQARWRAWGNDSELAVYPDTVHGFGFGYPFELARRAEQRIENFLEECFAH